MKDENSEKMFTYFALSESSLSVNSETKGKFMFLYMKIIHITPRRAKHP